MKIVAVNETLAMSLDLGNLRRASPIRTSVQPDPEVAAIASVSAETTISTEQPEGNK